MSDLVRSTIALVKFIINGEALNNSVQHYGFFDKFIQQFKVTAININKIPVRGNTKEDLISRIKTGFYFLKDDGLREVQAIIDGKIIDFDDFLFKMNIKINSTKKIGKRLGRMFRLYDHHMWFKNHQVSMYINKNHGMEMDGIWLMDIRLARKLDKKAKVGKIYSFTYLSNKMLAKGHVIIRENMMTDIIGYKVNVLNDITFREGNDLFIGLDNRKLRTKIRMNSQTLINFFEGLDPVNIWAMAIGGIYNLVNAIKNGTATKSMDNFLYTKDIPAWGLQEAVLRGVDYRKYKGLFRAVVSQTKKSMSEFGSKDDKAMFHFPVMNGFGAYALPDMINMDQYGNTTPTIKKGEVYYTEFGGVMFSLVDIEETKEIHGGMDWDDGMDNYPVLVNDIPMMFIERPPNDAGEYGIYKPLNLQSIGMEIRFEFTIHPELFAKRIVPAAKKGVVEAKPNNAHTDMMAAAHAKLKNMGVKIEVEEEIVYDKDFVRVTIEEQVIGVIEYVSNAAMIRSSIRIGEGIVLDQFAWNLEDTIDGNSNPKSVALAMYKHIVSAEIPVAKSMINRIPEFYYENGNKIELRSKVFLAEKHPVDLLLGGIEETINIEMDLLYSKADSVRGYVGMNINNDDVKQSAIKSYDWYFKNFQIANSVAESEEQRSEYVKEVKAKLLKWVNTNSDVNKTKVVSTWMGIANKTKKDQILWINGISSITLDVLASMGKAKHIEKSYDVHEDAVVDSIFGVGDDLEYGKFLRRYTMPTA